MSVRETVTIGELATGAGITRDAFRYDERLGLIAQVPHTTGGFRVYPAQVVERLRFVKLAQCTRTLAETPDAACQVVEDLRGATP